MALNQQDTAGPDKFGEALKLLLSHAANDTGGSRRCAAFLLSLWQGSLYKADLQELLYVDNNVHLAMITVFNCIYATNNQLYTYVSEEQMQPIIKIWGDAFAFKNE